MKWWIYGNIHNRSISLRNNVILSLNWTNATEERPTIENDHSDSQGAEVSSQPGGGLLLHAKSRNPPKIEEEAIEIEMIADEPLVSRLHDWIPDNGCMMERLI